MVKQDYGQSVLTLFRVEQLLWLWKCFFFKTSEVSTYELIWSSMNLTFILNPVNAISIIKTKSNTDHHLVKKYKGFPRYLRVLCRLCSWEITIREYEIPLFRLKSGQNCIFSLAIRGFPLFSGRWIVITANTKTAFNEGCLYLK